MYEYYIGIISGTSMNSIDAALVQFTKNSLQLIATHSKPITTELKQNLLATCFPGYDEINRMGQLDVQLGNLFAQTCLTLLKNAKIPAAKISAIGSHGQTIRHQPNFPYPFTLQIADPNIIADQTGITTVADFRRRDIATGGQGAPLVPALHNALFRTSKTNRIILNVGGIANVTILPADLQQPVTGFDTGPGNTLLDAWINEHLKKEYDVNGTWAESGKNHPTLLKKLLSDAYFKKSPPKSTGREYFNLDWLKLLLPENIPPADVQNTLTLFTAETILNAIKNDGPKNGEIVVCGGGVHNSLLMKYLKNGAENFSVHTTQEFGVDPNWVEAIAFAWLAKQTLANKPGNLPQVTGGRRSVILGGIYK
jgi:anhydro-N-acetylmuramic acid kinase